MKVFPVLVALGMSASVAVAQQPPVAPTSPTPPAAPAPVAAPAPTSPRTPRTPAPAQAPLPAPRIYYGPDGFGYIDSDAIRKAVDESVRAGLMTTEKLDRVREASQRAMELGMKEGQRAMEESQRAMEQSVRESQRASEFAAQAIKERINDYSYRYETLAPLAAMKMDLNFGQTIAGSVNGAMASAYALAPMAFQTGWSQDRDPADSVWNIARDAFNRGDWRRSADMFAQVYSKYPKSTRVQLAAYYEAFSRYRIGTMDELRNALRVLNERGQGSSNSTNTNEVAILTTRIRGALAQRGDAEAARQLQADAQKGRNCDSEDMQVRSEALSALAQMDMATATPALRKVLDKKDPCTLELRRSALRILLRRADTAATSAAVAVARNNEETIDLRTDAIQYLSRLPGDNAQAALEDLLRNSTDRDIQRAAIRSLSSTDNSKARQSIRMLIDRNDVSEQLRLEAINSFERDRGTNESDAAFLRGVYPKLQSDQLKRAAIAAISKNPGTENEQFVLAVARNANESSDVRGNAISRMYRIPAITIADIGKLYDNSDSRSMRDQIVNVLSQRKEPEAVDKLIDIARNSTDRSTRSQAISALGRKTDDPRAKKALQDLIGGGQ